MKKAVDVLPLLLKYIPANKQNGASAPLLAAALCGDEKIVQTMLDAGAHINEPARQPRARTVAKNPLREAVLRSREGIVKFLLEQGADPEHNQYRNPTNLAVGGKRRWRGRLTIGRNDRCW